MAQKKAIAAKGKKAANGVEKPAVKRGAKVLEEEEIVVAQSPSKKSKKQPVKEVPQSSEEESDTEEQNGDQAEDDSDSEAEEASDLIDDEAEEDEEEDTDEEDSDNEVEPGEVSKDDTAGEEEDSDDEAPIENPFTKKGKETKKSENSEESEEKNGIPKVRIGRVPPETPKNQIIFVKNLPAESKHKDVIALFSKFGPISIMNRFTNKEGLGTALIAFETAAGPEAVLQAKPKALTIGTNVLSVSQPKDKQSLNDRTVIVNLIGPKITKEDLKTYFEKVAPVELVTISPNRLNPKAFVLLTSVDDVPKALKLHSTELFSRFITVRPVTPKTTATLKSSDNTIVVENLNKHESYSAEALEKIFKKFGELEDVDVVCSKTVLAFVTFKQSEAAAKALDQLQDKTVNKVELKLHRYERASSGKTILVTNLAKDTTEDDLRKVFNESGDIESVQMMGIKAIVKFANDDGFCKSFLANERIVNNVPIFIEPNSLLKHRLLKKRAAIGQAHVPAKFQKNVKSFGNKPFNKRPFQDNGRRPFVKRAKF